MGLKMTYSYAPLDDDAEWEAQKARKEQEQAKYDEMIRVVRPCLHSAFPGGWWHGNPVYVGGFNIEDYYSERTDEWKLGGLSVPCRGCRRRFFPFCSRTLVNVDGGWRWVGLDHQEPYTDYFAACGWCGTPMLLTIYVPQ